MAPLAPAISGDIARLCSWLIVGAGLAFFSLARVEAGTSQLYWSDARTGIAIGGYDPVAYFADGRARAGKAAYELAWAGGTWRFANQGNREVFRRDPQVYAPRFGGYDALQVARGFVASGNPLVWVIRRQRLYLFSTLGQRDQWSLDDALILTRAEENWTRLRQTLVR